ncbi:TolC family protein [Nitritalea halalkaliphila]|uniref:TolC family protein n=1 Tax=Nitritalea halalkaliphila TaxID=590849 RepID=UPI0002F40D2B|nr:TolC family protein [Nitritalea halalkaliphila]
MQYTVEQDIINFEQEIFTKVRNFSMLKERLEITELADKVAEKRYNLALRRYQESSFSLTDLTIAQQEKDQNRRATLPL